MSFGNRSSSTAYDFYFLELYLNKYDPYHSFYQMDCENKKGYTPLKRKKQVELK